ncbi:hypothetical protein IAR50_007295 [Cryptococcus sp. DSM 104548]
MAHDLPPHYGPAQRSPTNDFGALSSPLGNSSRSSSSPFFASPEPTATPTSSRLKRLSLVARPTSLDLDREPGSARSARSPAPSTPDGAVRRPRSAIIGRSSVSYSPAVSRYSLRSETGEIDARKSLESGLKDGGGASGEIGQEGSEGSDVVDDPQTFMDRHADLLRQIAEKERKVIELKQDLHQQESSLQQLKSRWITLVSRAARSPSAEKTPDLTSSSHSLSTSSTSSSLFPIEESTITTRSPEQSIGIENALSGMISQAEEYLSPEVMEGGKKFLGNLWRTVGAAANGKTPEGEEDRRLGDVGQEGALESEKKALESRKRKKEGGWAPFGSTFDLSGLQSIITPWEGSSSRHPLSSAPRQQVSNPRPSNTSPAPSSPLLEF